MGKLVDQVQKLTRGYVRKGGKTNRKQQAARMMAFASHAEALGAHEMGQVGANHVLSYYRAIRRFSESTRYSHYRAIATLWMLAGKFGNLPIPLESNSTLTETEARTTAKPGVSLV